MQWTKTNYPASMKSLPPQIRNQAIDIANSLRIQDKMLADDVIVDIAIRTATEFTFYKNEMSSTQSRKNSPTQLFRSPLF